MPVLDSNLDVTNDQFQRNRAVMEKKLATLDSLQRQAGGGDEAMARLRSPDKLSMRERIARALDPDTHFLEISMIAGWRSSSAVGSAFVLGLGVIAGIECVIVGCDPALRAGTFNPFDLEKLRRGLEIARQNRLPYVQLVESSVAALRGAAGSEDPEAAVQREDEHFVETGRLFYEITELSRLRIPTVSVSFGAVPAEGAYQPGMSDYNIFIRGQSRVSLGDYLADNEVHALELLREIMSHLNWRKIGPGPRHAPELPVHDPDGLLGLVAENLKTPFDIREVIARIVDGSRFEEFKAHDGRTLVCGWAVIHGFPVGVLGNNGALFSESAEKAAQFIQLCNKIDVPLLFLHNVTGYAVGTRFDPGGISSNGSKMINALANSEVPHISVIIGASYGAGNYAMSGRAFNTRFTFTWPTAKIAVMGPRQMAGVTSIVGRASAAGEAGELDLAEDAKRTEQGAYRTEDPAKGLSANSRVADDGMIDPRDTRDVVGIALSACHSNRVAGAAESGTWRM